MKTKEALKGIVDNLTSLTNNIKDGFDKNEVSSELTLRLSQDIEGIIVRLNSLLDELYPEEGPEDYTD